jgi:hypothetical protein
VSFRAIGHRGNLMAAPGAMRTKRHAADRAWLRPRRPPPAWRARDCGRFC